MSLLVMQHFGKDILVQTVSLAYLTLGTIAVNSMFEMAFRHTCQDLYGRMPVRHGSLAIDGLDGKA